MATVILHYKPLTVYSHSRVGRGPAMTLLTSAELSESAEQDWNGGEQCVPRVFSSPSSWTSKAARYVVFVATAEVQEGQWKDRSIFRTLHHGH